MMTRLPVLSLCLGVMTAGLPAQDPPGEPEKHLLRYALSEGATGHYSLSQGGDIRMDMGGQAIAMSTRIGMYFSYKVLAVQDGKAKVEQTCTRVAGKMDNPGMGNIEFDSADPDTNAGPLDAMLDMVGEAMTFTVDDRGQISDVQLTAALRRAKDTGVNLEESFSQSIPTLPEAPIAVGATWTSKTTNTMGQMGQVEVDVTNKLVGCDGSTCTIEQDMRMDFDNAGGQMKVVGKTNQARTKLLLDLTHHIPQSLDGDIEIEIAEPMPMSMKIALQLRRTEPQGDKPADARTDRGDQAGKSGDAGR